MHHLDSSRIAALNDETRQTFTGCRVFITAGIQAQDELFVAAVISAVREFECFGPDNDPYGEHDFGRVDVLGEVVFWKFDYYDLDLEMASLDPANPDITARVLTIMLADEY
jgi:hypothetical protein